MNYRRATSHQFIDIGLNAGLSEKEIQAEMARDRAEHGPFADEAPAAPVRQPRAPVSPRDQRNQMFAKYGEDFATHPTMYNKLESGEPLTGLESARDALTGWSRLGMAAVTTPLGYLGSKINGPPVPNATVSQEQVPADVSNVSLPRGVPGQNRTGQVPVPQDPNAYDPTDSFYGNFLHEMATGGGSGIANDPSLAAQVATSGVTGRAAEGLVGLGGKYLPNIPFVSKVFGRGAQLATEGAIQGVTQAGVNRGLGGKDDYLPAIAYGAGGNVIIGGVPYAMGSVIRALRKGVQPSLDAVRPLATPGNMDPALLLPDENGIQLSPAQVMGERGGPRAAAEMTLQTHPVLGEYPRNLKERNIRATNKTALEMRQGFPDAPTSTEGLQDIPAERGKALNEAATGAQRATGRTFGSRMEEVGNQPAVAPDLGDARQAAKDQYLAQGLDPADVKAGMRLQEGMGGRDFYRGHKVSRETIQPAAAARRQEFGQHELYQGLEELPDEWQVHDLGPNWRDENPHAGGRFSVTSADGDLVVSDNDRAHAIQRGVERAAPEDRNPSFPPGFEMFEYPNNPDPGKRWAMVASDADNYPLVYGATRENVLEQVRQHATRGNIQGTWDFDAWQPRQPRAQDLPPGFNLEQRNGRYRITHGENDFGVGETPEEAAANMRENLNREMEQYPQYRGQLPPGVAEWVDRGPARPAATQAPRPATAAPATGAGRPGFPPGYRPRELTRAEAEREFGPNTDVRAVIVDPDGNYVGWGPDFGVALREARTDDVFGPLFERNVQELNAGAPAPAQIAAPAEQRLSRDNMPEGYILRHLEPDELADLGTQAHPWVVETETGDVVGSGRFEAEALVDARTDEAFRSDEARHLGRGAAPATNAHAADVPDGFQLTEASPDELADNRANGGVEYAWTVHSDEGDVVGTGMTREEALADANQDPEFRNAPRSRPPEPLSLAERFDQEQANFSARKRAEAANARVPEGLKLEKRGPRDFALLDDKGQVVHTGLTANAAIDKAQVRIAQRKTVPYEGAWKDPAPKFASGLTRHVSGLKQKSWGSGKELAAALDGAPGIKAEERKWTGLDLWLEGQKGKVTKDQVLQWLQNNEVSLTEHKLVSKDLAPPEPFVDDEGGNPDKWVPSADGSKSTYHDKENGIMWEASLDNEKIRATTRGKQFTGMTTEALEAQIRRAFPSEFPGLRMEDNRGARGFKEYSMPGGKDYSEARFEFGKAQLTRRLAEFKEYLAANPDQVGQPWVRQYKRFLKNSETSDFQSSHYSTPRLALHTRWQSTTLDGEKATMWEEGQADVVNKAREVKDTKYGGFRPRMPGDAADLELRGHMTLEELDAAEERIYAARRNIDAAQEEHGMRSNEFHAESSKAHDTQEKEINRLNQRVMDTPWKGNSYPELAFKSMLREAAESGSKWLIWPEGKFQDIRYHGSKADGTSGLVKLYDKTIPTYAAKYIKKWGGKLERKTWDPGLDPNQMSGIDMERLHKTAAGEKDAITSYLDEGGFGVWAIRIPDDMAKSVVYESQTYFQKRPGMGADKLKGSYKRKGREVTLFPAADASTMFHEVLGHDNRNTWLKKTDEKPFTDWMESQGIKVLDARGNWTRKAEESFASAVESMLFGGDVPGPPEIKAPLARAAIAMKKLYEAGDLPEVTPAMKEAFAKSLTPKEIVANMKQQVTATPVGPGEIKVENESQKALKEELKKVGADYDVPDADYASEVPPPDAGLVRKYIDAADHAKTFKQIVNLKRNLGNEHFEGLKSGAFSKGRGDVLIEGAYSALDNVGKTIIRRELPKDLAEELVTAFETANAEYSKNRKGISALSKATGTQTEAFDPTKATFYVTYKMKPDLINRLKTAADESPDMKPVWEQLQAAFGDGYLAKSLTTAGTSPNMWKLSPAKLIAEWNKIPGDTKKAFFPDGGEKWSRFLGRLSKLNVADADLFNPSGTGRLQENATFMKKLFSPSDWTRAFAENYVNKLLLPNVERYYTTGSFGNMGTVFDILDAAKTAEEGLRSRPLRTAITAMEIADKDKTRQKVGDILNSKKFKIGGGD